MKKFLLLILLTSIISFSSCESYLGGDFNADPNNPIEVPITVQLPSIHLNLIDASGGLFSRFNNMLVQQVEGVTRQCFSNNRYTGLTPNRYNAVWQNVYENVLNEIQIAKQTSEEVGYNHHLGVLKVTEALTLMMATDVWDNIPYSNAFKGLDELNPTYDTQDEIYDVIFKLLEDGINLLNGVGGVALVGKEDIIYEGNIDNWIKAAYAIKARGLLHHKKYTEALDAAKLSFDDADQNMGFRYIDESAACQWYRFNRDREGDIEFHPTMRNLMDSLNDTTRLQVIDQTFNTDHTYLTADYFEELITYREVQFIIAETDFRLTSGGGTQEGHDAYINGIKASFGRLGLKKEDSDIYLSQPNISKSVGNLSLEDIMTQKYIAMYLNQEAYSDWRRTGIPELNPISGSLIPVRWHYSANEYQFNSNAPTQESVDIFMDRVGWNR